MVTVIRTLIAKMIEYANTQTVMIYALLSAHGFKITFFPERNNYIYLEVETS